MRGVPGKVISKLVERPIRAFVPKGYVSCLIDKGQVFYFNPSDSAQGYTLWTRGRYGVGTELMAQKLFTLIIREGDVVVDVGAHFGFYTLLAAVRVGSLGKVLAFEPSEYNFRVLRINVAVNRFSNVRLFRVALASKAGKAFLGIPKGGLSGENTLAIKPSVAKRVEVVKLRRFDEIAIREKLRHADVVKIDVEGAEYDVIEGFDEYLNIIKVIIVEVHPIQMRRLGTDLKNLYKILWRHGFSIYRLDSRRGLVLVNSISFTDRHHIVCVSDSSRLNFDYLELFKYDLVNLAHLAKISPTVRLFKILERLRI